jgi:hypothetical protein
VPSSKHPFAQALVIMPPLTQLESDIMSVLQLAVPITHG